MIKKLSIEPIDKTNSLQTFTLVLFAFIFCVCIKLIWAYQFSQSPDIKWNDEFMITTNDGYYYAEGVRDLIAGFHQENDLSPVLAPLSKLAHLIHTVFSFSAETIFFYLSAFISAMLVIPFTLLGRRLHMGTAGFIAGIIATLGNSYYSRSVVGYFDTDMLNIFFPMMLIWSLSLALKTNENKYLLFTGLEIVAYRWWYPQSYSIEFAFFGLVLLYVLFFERKSFYHFLLLSIMLIGMSGFPDLTRLLGVLAVFSVIFIKQIRQNINIFYALFAVCVVLFFYADGFAPIWQQLKNYVFRDVTRFASGEIQLHFYSVMQTIVESSGEKPNFEDFSSRISGSPFLFIISISGYIWLCVKQPVMLLMLPLLGLGSLSYSSGVRFSMYGVPVLAFGLGFLIVKYSEFISSTSKEFSKPILITCVILATSASLYPSIKFIYEYRVGPVFNTAEVSLIDNFKKTSAREDYVIAWWDYGYPLRYYGDIKTLIDGAKHEGEQNFPVSFMLTNSQKSAANLARLDVEYTEKRFAIEKINQNKSESEQIKIPTNNIAWMIKDYGFSDSNDFLLSLRTNIALPQKTRDIYFYLPFRMDSIFPTIGSFSNMDLMNGKMNRNMIFILSRDFEEDNNMINFKNGITYDKRTNTIRKEKDIIDVKRFVVASYVGNSLKANTIFSNPSGGLSLIYSAPHGTIFIMDENTFNSTYVQLFFLEQYDPELFEFVSGNGYAKFYKLKI